MRFYTITYSLFLVLMCMHCAQAPPPPTPPSTELYNLNALEQRIHNLVNQERSSMNIPELSWNDQLASIARMHSTDMLETDYFSHNTPAGLTPADRADAAGFDCIIEKEGSQRIGIGENIITSFSYHSYEISEANGQENITYNWKSSDELAKEIVSTWMNSRGHRRNILSPDYIQEGIGAVVGANQKVLVTQNFC